MTVNGEQRELHDGATVAEAVDTVFDRPAAARGVAVAVNGEVVPRSSWDEVRLEGSDRVEVLRAVGGG